MSPRRQTCSTLLRWCAVRTRDLRRAQPQIRYLHSTTQIVDSEPPPEAVLTSSESQPAVPGFSSQTQPSLQSDRRKGVFSPQYDLRRTPVAPSALETSQRPPITLSESARIQLPQLVAQPPFYATIHIHGKPYLVTPGDTVRLPFLMHGVLPGDVLRLDRATIIGSRDFTLKGGSSEPNGEALSQTSTSSEPISGKTEGLDDIFQSRPSVLGAPSKASLKTKGPPAYLDDRLFVCRATVMGAESEPMRIKEKTKRRQRHIKHVKSKHRYTILRISEITPKTLEDVEAETPSSER